MIDMFKPYIDEYGWLVGSKEDPGDSCHRTCMYHTGLKWFKNIIYHRSILFIVIGFRHPSPGWWRDLDRFSADQATAFVIFLSEVGYYSALKLFFKRHFSRCGFFTNTRHICC